MMIITEIEEYNETAHEAIVKVSDGFYTVECFSQPCLFQTGIEWVEPLECLNVYNIYVDDSNERLSKLNVFMYEIVGTLSNRNKGIVNVGDLSFHINAQLIPKDICEGQRIYFVTDRIDIY